MNVDQQLTKRTGKCTQFEYEFTKEGSIPHSTNSRPIPFTLRNQAREQIQAMLNYGVLEESHSACIHPVSLLVRERKAVRIFIDVRRISRQMVADHKKIIPKRELVQNFCDAKYITSLELNSAFLKVHLEKSSRQWTECQFENNVYQFKADSRKKN